MILREVLNQLDASSGQGLIKCNKLTTKLNKHNSFNVSSDIKLPENIENKKAYDLKLKVTIVSSMLLDVLLKKPAKDAEKVKQCEKYITDEIFAGYEYSMSLRECMQ